MARMPKGWTRKEERRYQSYRKKAKKQAKEWSSDVILPRKQFRTLWREYENLLDDKSPAQRMNLIVKSRRKSQRGSVISLAHLVWNKIKKLPKWSDTGPNTTDWFFATGTDTFAWPHEWTSYKQVYKELKKADSSAYWRLKAILDSYYDEHGNQMVLYER